MNGRKKIGSYQLIKSIGKGGMGEVFKAKDIVLERMVAIKALKQDLANDESQTERFVQEARTLAKLNHPNIAGLYNVLQEENQLYMVMEFVHGLTLEQILKSKNGLPVDQVTLISQKIISGLNHAHMAGIVHRDIKPSNVMINEKGSVKVMDFGISIGEGVSRFTKTGHIIGTLEYLAPEIIKGEEPTFLSDQYSLGILMYEMLTGRTPFTGTNEYAVLQAHLANQIPQLDKSLSVPSDLQKIIKKCTQKNPAKRFQNNKDLIRALQQVKTDRQKQSKIAFPTLKSMSHSIDIPKVTLSKNLKNVIFAIPLILILALGVYLWPENKNTDKTNSTLLALGEMPIMVENPKTEPKKLLVEDEDTESENYVRIIAKGEQLLKTKKLLPPHENLLELMQVVEGKYPGDRHPAIWLKEMLKILKNDFEELLKKRRWESAKEILIKFQKVKPKHPWLTEAFRKLEDAKQKQKVNKKTITISKKQKSQPLSESKKPKSIQPKEVVSTKRQTSLSETKSTKNPNNTQSIKNKTIANLVPEKTRKINTPKKDREKVTIPVQKGTSLILAINKNFSSDDFHRENEKIEFTIAKEVVKNGAIVFRKGDKAIGYLKKFKSSQGGDKGLVVIEIKQVKAIDGNWLDLRRSNFKIGGEKGVPILLTPSMTFQVETDKSTTVMTYKQ